MAKTNKTRNTPNLFDYKLKRFFDYTSLSAEEATRGTIGIPRVLNMFENYPFWHTFFTCLGYRVILSPLSVSDSSENVPKTDVSGAASRNASVSFSEFPDSVCIPAKLARSHILWLLNEGIKNIFYPCVAYERCETKGSCNNRNCPVVSSYPEYLRNNVEDLSDIEITYLSPFVSFESEAILTERLCDIFTRYGVPEFEIRMASLAGWKELCKAHDDIIRHGDRVLRYLRKTKRFGIVLAGYPYFTDPVLNHGIAEKIASCGIPVLTEDSVPMLGRIEASANFCDSRTYSSRLISAAAFVAGRRNLEFIGLLPDNCSICGIDAENIAEILSAAKKKAYFISCGVSSPDISEILQMLSTLSGRKVSKIRNKFAMPAGKRVTFTNEMKNRYTVLCPTVRPSHFEMICAIMQRKGYKLEAVPQNLPEGVASENPSCKNDINLLLCALKSGNFDTGSTAVLYPKFCNGCLSDNIPKLLRHELNNAGFAHVPVIAPGFENTGKNPGFKLNPSVIIRCLQAVAVCDLLDRLLCRTLPYESEPGSAAILYEALLCKFRKTFASGKPFLFKRSIKKAVRDFESLPLNDTVRKPTVGLTGVPFSGFLCNTLRLSKCLFYGPGLELMPSDLLDFFYFACCIPEASATYLGKKQKRAKFCSLMINAIIHYRGIIDKVLEKSKRFEPSFALETLSGKASAYLTPGNLEGLGRLSAGEAAGLAESGAGSVILLCSAGCLSGSINVKGLEKALSKHYPNITFRMLEYSSSESEDELRSKLLDSLSRE